jgi:toxin-antitoxin system PIN domain toxin
VTFLLDVNVLVALIDPTHVGHDAAHAWFSATGAASWATCPITENGVIRILGHPKYPNSAGSPAAVAPIVFRLRALPGHVFWPDGLSLIQSDLVDTDRVTTPGQVADTYLLALAVANEGQLATFDRHLSSDAVRHGRAGLHLIATAESAIGRRR